MAEFIDVIRRFRKLSVDEDENLKKLGEYLDEDDLRFARGLVKEKKVRIGFRKLSLADIEVPFIETLKQGVAVSGLNDAIKDATFKQFSNSFARCAKENIELFIAPDIVGFDSVKKAVALQLFSPEKVHILLLGDPGTGKTVVLNSATEFALISSMGLGSGTSGVGLAVTVKGKEVMKGLLPMADGGICAIDELNLMKEESRASLYNAMEKGFVSYDKGGNSFKFDARVSVLATANPLGDKFTGKTVGELKKQLPFDAALLSRFHLVFIIRKHTRDEFKEITKSVIQGKKKTYSELDKDLLKQYIKEAHSIKEVSVPKRLEEEIVEFTAHIKDQEEKLLFEVSPRLAVGFIRLAKASARMELRKEVTESDVKFVKGLYEDSLKL